MKWNRYITLIIYYKYNEVSYEGQLKVKQNANTKSHRFFFPNWVHVYISTFGGFDRTVKCFIYIYCKDARGLLLEVILNALNLVKLFIHIKFRIQCSGIFLKCWLLYRLVFL